MSREKRARQRCEDVWFYYSISDYWMIWEIFFDNCNFWFKKFFLIFQKHTNDCRGKLLPLSNSSKFNFSKFIHLRRSIVFSWMTSRCRAKNPGRFYGRFRYSKFYATLTIADRWLKKRKLIHQKNYKYEVLHRFRYFFLSIMSDVNTCFRKFNTSYQFFSKKSFANFCFKKSIPRVITCVMRFLMREIFLFLDHVITFS